MGIFNYFSSEEKKSAIEKFFDDKWFTQKFNIIQSAFSGDLKDEYPDIPFTAEQIKEYARNDDFNLWSSYGEFYGNVEKAIDDTSTSISNGASDFVDSVSQGFTIAKYIPIVVVAAYVYSIVKKK